MSAAIMVLFITHTWFPVHISHIIDSLCYYHYYNCHIIHVCSCHHVVKWSPLDMRDELDDDKQLFKFRIILFCIDIPWIVSHWLPSIAIVFKVITWSSVSHWNIFTLIAAINQQQKLKLTFRCHCPSSELNN